MTCVFATYVIKICLFETHHMLAAILTSRFMIGTNVTTFLTTLFCLSFIVLVYAHAKKYVIVIPHKKYTLPALL